MLGTGPEVPIAAKYNPHPITEHFNVLTAYSVARSVTPNQAGANNRFAQNLVETSPKAWGETDIKALMTSGQVGAGRQGRSEGPGLARSRGVGADARARRRAGAERRRPLTRPSPRHASSSSATPTSPSNRWLGISGNRDLFLNTVNWLAQQENLISIRAKDPEDRRITLSADQDRRIFWITIFIIPGLILLMGIQAWWRRR